MRLIGKYKHVKLDQITVFQGSTVVYALYYMLTLLHHGTVSYCGMLYA